MKAVTGCGVNRVWEDLKPKVDVHITRKINKFHDALVERGQIKALPAQPDPTEELSEHS